MGGEFGPILKTGLGDSFMGNVEWARWKQVQPASLAVFRFAVPKAASHYSSISAATRNPKAILFRIPSTKNRDIAANFISIPPQASSIASRCRAVLTDAAPVGKSEIAVEYGPVNIGGKNYICPIRGVAVSDVRNLVMESVDQLGLEKHIHVVRSLNYHKFGSTARNLTK